MSQNVYAQKIEEYVKQKQESKSFKKPNKGLLAPKNTAMSTKNTTQLEAIEKVGEFIYTIRKMREQLKADK